MAVLTLYRGTTELWERAVIEAQSPPRKTSLITGKFMRGLAKQKRNLEKRIRKSIRHQPCSLLRSGKEIVLRKKPLPITQLTATQIEAEIVARVGFETAFGTPNFNSHFVPCGTNAGISDHFGHGSYYRFQIQGEIYGSKKKDIDRYARERNQLPRYVVPLFEGGNNEVLAYTGSLITSVVLMQGTNVQYEVMNSLD